MGALRVEVPPGDHEGRAVTAIVRPHDVEVSGRVEGTHGPGAASVATGRIQRMNRVGPMMKLQLALADGQPLTVELTRERVAELGVSEGDTVIVNLREAKIFVQDYAI